jgi:6-phosphogluconolactonase
VTKSVLFSAVGAKLTRYEVDAERATVEERDAIVLPAGLQYAWPSPSSRFLYAACSDGRPGRPGHEHCVVALRMECEGDLAIHGAPIALPARPVHISTDRDGRHVLIVFPLPSGLSVRRINDDGSIGDEIAQHAIPRLGKTAHQILANPGGDRIVLSVRGDDATSSSAEFPGAVLIFAYRDGQLAPLQEIAPNGGYEFGPRHVAFHPSRPWFYLSLERQNEIAFFDMAHGAVEGPKFRRTTLANPALVRPRQLAGAIHVHPEGRFVYVANRADGKARMDGIDVFAGGENSIGVFGIDQRTGEPSLIQSVDTRGMYPRTFHIDPGGRLLIVGNMVAYNERDGNAVRSVPAGHSVFRIAPDGQLAFVRNYPVEVGDELLFWIGIVGTTRAG